VNDGEITVLVDFGMTGYAARSSRYACGDETDERPHPAEFVATDPRTDRSVHGYVFERCLAAGPDEVAEKLEHQAIHLEAVADEMRALATCEWLFPADAFGQPGFDPQDAVGFWDETNRQDWNICERSQLGISSRAYEPGPYSPREGMAAAWDREFLRAIGHTGPHPLSPAPQRGEGEHR
jgi:phenylpropionate dioxygenase-like ring-hydroxylating dioxygenase large terminal subunit